MEAESKGVSKWAGTICLISILVLLYVISLNNYLFFHSISEVFRIVIAIATFLIVWNTRHFINNSYLNFIGIAYLFIGSIDLLHTLSYKGMGVFEGYGSNLPTQLWISARYMESISLLLAPFLINKRSNISLIFTIYLAIFSLLFMSNFVWRIFPDCFIDGEGLTTFKIISEYIISLISIGAALILYKKRANFDPNVYKLVTAAIIVSIFAELSFTFYISVYGLSNLIGHYFKIVSFYLIYKAIIETGLNKPYDLLFRNLKISENQLRNERNTLQAALDEIKELKGIIPICSMCKKIRDDEGFWDQFERYISKHSDAEFSHSICPDCSQKHYPDLGIYDE